MESLAGGARAREGVGGGGGYALGGRHFGCCLLACVVFLVVFLVVLTVPFLLIVERSNPRRGDIGVEEGGAARFKHAGPRESHQIHPAYRIPPSICPSPDR